ncbi:hypothetical protein ASPZODRAFT_146262 [Penicilliopsis zonata CBS 506.65]|uniref:Myb-like DNA-binding domain-containing protein n=1 Tax=Penicilliopsis zonata CBS 506.65 TaxID=1073090 RepID=A0A1L9S7V6_9EURO|nr:hypothetical protein ASPZODRAFT_146262 [Penicilliopsis zonata CBS 506.65]OJJ43239.1 hypothetical protein ASPZODRAFT_146262 [Penicilliopsis zonata CBS 506.65]
MTTPVRRSKAMPTDGPTARFLYTIIKQLDLKSIDWNLVASQLEISNGHAARMRYSRFKQQMEGTTSTPRASRPKKTGSKKGEKRPISPPPPPPARSNPMAALKQEQTLPQATAPFIKTDPSYTVLPDLSSIPAAQAGNGPVVNGLPMQSIENPTSTATATPMLPMGYPGMPVYHPMLEFRPVDMQSGQAAKAAAAAAVAAAQTQTQPWSSLEQEEETPREELLVKREVNDI